MSTGSLVRKRDRPYHEGYVQSIQRRAFRPQDFRRRLVAFMEQWRDETPGDIHASGVEWEKPGRIIRGDGTGVSDPGGGSRQGAPRYTGASRSYIEGMDSRTERATSGGEQEMGESYATPMRWAVRFIERSRHPLLAAVLRWIGASGDYRDLAVTCGTCTSAVTLPDEYSEAIAREALRLVWTHYEEGPT